MSRRTGKGKKWYYDLVTSVPADLGTFASFSYLSLLLLSLGGLLLAGWMGGSRQAGRMAPPAGCRTAAHITSTLQDQPARTLPFLRSVQLPEDSREFALFYCFYCLIVFCLFRRIMISYDGFECVVNSDRDFGLKNLVCACWFCGVCLGTELFVW